MNNSYSLSVQYEGTEFCGFQSQPKNRNVQDEISAILKRIFGKLNKYSFSGRTDSGVHAEDQHVHFLSDKKVDIKRTAYSISRMLPEDISLNSFKKEENYTDARRTATSREYKYLFSNSAIPCYLRKRISKVLINTSIEEYNRVARIFIGTHNFLHFRKVGSKEKSTIRTIRSFEFRKRNFVDLYDESKTHEILEAHIVANSYLYRMVRNLMGAIFEVVSGKNKIESLQELLRNGTGNFKYPVAEASGLTLFKVNY